MDTPTALRSTVAALSVLGIVFWLVLAYHRPNLRMVSIAPISWLFHVLMFTLARFLVGLSCITAVSYNIWSHAVRIHGLILLIAAAIVIFGARDE